jgi:hypothetical protein
MATSSQGQGKGSFTVAGVKVSEITRFVETSNNLGSNANTIDVSHLGTTGTTSVTIAALPDLTQAGQSPTEYQIDYIGDPSLGPVFYVGQANSAHTVTASSFTLAVGDVPRGSVTFAVG